MDNRMGRRAFTYGAGALAAGAVLGRPGSLHAAQASPVSGPVRGGKHGWPFALPLFDAGANSYRSDEYIFGGEAVTYRLVGEARPDGAWKTEAAGKVPFRSRFFVLRPPASRFNGTVLVSWNNVSSGFDIPAPLIYRIFDEGFAFVGVTAQRAGVHGLPKDPAGLIQWDPERYGDLSIPTDDASFDIFTQAARLVGPGRPLGGVDPMGGLPVKRLIAVGGSQSAARLAGYINGVAPHSRIFDAYLLTVHFGGASPMESPPGSPIVPRQLTRFRTDLGAKVMLVNSENEVLRYLPVRQPDTDSFRFWEIAGTAHAGRGDITRLQVVAQHDFGPDFMKTIRSDVNAVDTLPVQAAALHHLQRWLTTGTPPPVAPRIEVTGDPPVVRRDGDGAAMGGIRLPQVEAPIATNRATDDLSGQTEPFSKARLAALYPDHGAYVARFEAAARKAEAAGFILKGDAERMIADARNAAIPA